LKISDSRDPLSIRVKTLIIIPTYNEKENILLIIAEIRKLQPSYSILVVDDNSPDGTGQLVKNLQDPQVHLLARAKKDGLGRAYVAGFEWGVKNGFEILVEMDADFSHRPMDLGKVVAAATENDFAIGSRYVQGGSTVNWGLFRKLISKAGGIYSRLILGFPINDWTGGFNAWQTKVLNKIGINEIQSNGYSFQIELKYRALKAGFKGAETPIVFEERRLGKSKMSLKIVIEALVRVWHLKFKIV
jgi:dolichol-phosphate mannosyltransferase